ncbi:MAG: DUF2934 domain-containing protein [Gammaproteobacteria bacterium]|nr:MAG: DUF2934 domain-containing protein [Gammaproteobacteria bacterium]
MEQPNAKEQPTKATRKKAVKKKSAKKKATTKKAAKKKTAKKAVTKKTAGKATVRKKATRKKKAATASRSSNTRQKRISFAEFRERVAVAAYYLAERRLFENGVPEEDWLEAERQIREALAREGVTVEET